MELIFGGAYQGKTQYAAEKYHCKDEEIFTCEGIELDRTARCIRHLERFAKACTDKGLDAREEFERQNPGAVCLIADDISCGMLLSAVHTEKGEEKLHLIMVDDAIPAGAKLC